MWQDFLVENSKPLTMDVIKIHNHPSPPTTTQKWLTTKILEIYKNIYKSFAEISKFIWQYMWNIIWPLGDLIFQVDDISLFRFLGIVWHYIIFYNFEKFLYILLVWQHKVYHICVRSQCSVVQWSIYMEIIYTNIPGGEKWLKGVTP